MLNPTKQQITDWYTSLSEEDVQEFNSNPWNKTLEPHLPTTENKPDRIEKETTDSPIIEKEPPILEEESHQFLRKSHQSLRILIN